MKVVYCAYREWALSPITFIEDQGKALHQNFELARVNKPEELAANLSSEVAIIFFIGWSWIVPKAVVNDYMCICFHPSQLPKYRGGSPIQNQIIDGLKVSAGTFFKMTSDIDTGPIYSQETLELDGDLSDIFSRMSILVSNGVVKAIREYPKLTFIEQDHAAATYCSRRTPEMSEITIGDLTSQTAEQIHNKVRSLQSPYPNAYIEVADGTRLYIQRTSLD